MKTAEEILDAIDQLEAAERWKLLSMMYDAYYNSVGHGLTRNHEDVIEY